MTTPQTTTKPGAPPAQPSRAPRTGDPEMDATARVFKLLSTLDEPARRRIVAYLADRFLPANKPMTGGANAS